MHNAQHDDTPKLILSTPMRVALLLCITFVCFFLMSVLSGVMTSWGASVTTPKLRILTMIQDVLVFIVPAIATALMVTRVPARLLCINNNVRPATIILALLTLVASIPAMNMIISWNASLHLPESMASIETWMRASENTAGNSIKLVLGGTGVGDLIMSILIVGVAAGFSEELYFRGALQRLLGGGMLGRHGAVWIAALIFSIFHFQFFGFVPRVLLGAFFGYLLLWSGCLWLPMLTHIANNTLYVITNWMSLRHTAQEAASGMDATLQSWLPVTLSIILTVAGLILTRRSTR